MWILDCSLVLARRSIASASPVCEAGEIFAAFAKYLYASMCILTCTAIKAQVVRDPGSSIGAFACGYTRLGTHECTPISPNSLPLNMYCGVFVFTAAKLGDLVGAHVRDSFLVLPIWVDNGTTIYLLVMGF